MRIISHTCSNTEIICALGGAHLLVGVDDHSDFPAESLEHLPRIGPDIDIDIEKIIALKPDCVVTSLTVPGHERCLAKIQAAGLNHLVTQPVTLGDVITDIERIAHLIGHASAGQKLVAQFKKRLSCPKPSHPPAPLVVEWWPKPVIVPGARSWVNEMLELAGAYNPFGHHPAESLQISAKQATEAAPEGIIMSWCGVLEEKYRPHVVERREGWATIPAIINRHIYPISEAWLGRPGPRLLEGIDRLAGVVDLIRHGGSNRDL